MKCRDSCGVPYSTYCACQRTVSTVQWRTFPWIICWWRWSVSPLWVSLFHCFCRSSHVSFRWFFPEWSLAFWSSVGGRCGRETFICLCDSSPQIFQWRPTRKMLSQSHLARRRTSNVPWWCGLMAQQSYSHLPAFNSHCMRLASMSIHLGVKWLPRGPPVSIHCCINHQSSYGWSTGGYYIMPIAANALQQACLSVFCLLHVPQLFSEPSVSTQGQCLLVEADCDLRQLQPLFLSLWRPVSDHNIHITRLHGNRWGHMKQPVTYIAVVRTWTRRQDIEIMCDPGCFELWARLLTLLLCADLSAVFIMKSLLLWQKRPKLS